MATRPKTRKRSPRRSSAASRLAAVRLAATLVNPESIANTAEMIIAADQIDKFVRTGVIPERSSAPVLKIAARGTESDANRR